LFRCAGHQRIAKQYRVVGFDDCGETAVVSRREHSARGRRQEKEIQKDKGKRKEKEKRENRERGER